MRFAYQGEPGAFSEAAAARLHREAETLPCREFEDVFVAVESGRCTHGVLPIENSVGGSIHRNYDLLSEHELPIVGEVELRVEHALAALPGVSLDQVRRVYSHPQALAQCERFLRSLDRVDIVATYDTAGSARMIQEGDLRDTAAIASRRAAGIFGLSVLRDGVQDFDANITRFIVIARDPLPLGAPDKTSLVFALPNAPGALFKALSVFALRDIDLAKLESRPLRGRPWEYLFYVDLNASREEPRCARAIDHLGEFATFVRLLGSYRRWSGAP
jgi:prephenate dehydratase